MDAAAKIDAVGTHLQAFQDLPVHVFVIVFIETRSNSNVRSQPRCLHWRTFPKSSGFSVILARMTRPLEGTLSALRDAIQRELSAQLGRSGQPSACGRIRRRSLPAQLWETEIKTAVEQAVFFVPIVTPRAVNSHYCKFEFEAFLAREHGLERTDLVFPLLYIRVPALESEAEWREDPVLSIIGLRQYVDWRPFRHSMFVRPPSVKRLSASARGLSRHCASRGYRRKSVGSNRRSSAQAAR